MNNLMKWTLLFAAMMMVMRSGHATWSIGSISQVNGVAIHNTYFLTPNNAAFPVNAQAYVGDYVNGICQYTSIYNLGSSEILATGDTFVLDAYQLKNLIGLGHTCMSMYYTYRQQVIDTFQLTSDGFNYTGTIPATSEVTIL